jgi:CBS domain-containing protein
MEGEVSDIEGEGNLMTRDVATCRPEDPMAAAARIMWERDCGIVPVVDADGRPVGVVTDRDLQRGRDLVRTLMGISRHREVTAAV